MLKFESIAPYLEDPLVLIGFFLFLVFLFLRILIRQGIIPTLTKKDGFSFLKLLLLYGFVFGIILMVLGFALKYQEMSEKEQEVIVNQLTSELEENSKILNELKLNTENYLSINLNLSKVLRTDGITLLVLMFPDINLELDSTVNTIELANNSFDKIINNNLHQDQLQMNRLDAAGRAIRATIERTLPTLYSLADTAATRYQFNTTIWDANLESFRKVDIVDVTTFQDIYAEMRLIRNDYNVIARNSINFYQSVHQFFEGQLNKADLSSALSAERQTYSLIHDYSLNIYYAIEAINAAKLNL